MEDDLALVPDCIIRPFRPGDATEVRRLIEAVWQEHFGDHPDPFAREFIHTRLGDVDHAETAYAHCFCARPSRARLSAPVQLGASTTGNAS
jgi:hypothetical protein